MWAHFSSPHREVESLGDPTGGKMSQPSTEKHRNRFGDNAASGPVWSQTGDLLRHQESAVNDDQIRDGLGLSDVEEGVWNIRAVARRIAGAELLRIVG